MVVDGVRALTFEEFYRREFPRLLPMLVAWCGSTDTAEDIAQEALAIASRDWERVSALESPGTWVRRVALNRSSNAGRRRRRERSALQRVGDSSKASTTMPDLPDAQLWARVRSLPTAQRTAVVLYYVDDLNLADIAAVMGCSEGTVKTHLKRARTTLGAVTNGEDR